MDEVKAIMLVAGATSFNYAITNDRITVSAAVNFIFIPFGDSRDILTKKYMGFRLTDSFYNTNTNTHTATDFYDLSYTSGYHI
tara:strand:+ start:223 stop:471 length:249 start_codon:yes stop_codon:yes gene_type:complete